MTFEWSLPTRIVFGPGRLAVLPAELTRLSAHRVLVVTGRAALAQAGVLSRLEGLLSGFETRTAPGVSPNLPLAEVEALIALVRDFHPDAVVGIGGGSALDGAKAAALIGPQQGGAADWLGGHAGGPGVPFIAVPTTAGTGSEVTPFMIILDEAARVKRSLGRPQAFPRIAIVDPELTVSLAPDQTASTGLDALSHALEAYWSIQATPLSDTLALEAVELVMANLAPAFFLPQDLDARAAMAYAATVAGMALAQTATAAVHGITYPLTALYNVPHGFACAFLLREIMAVNFHHLQEYKQKRLLHACKAHTLQAAIDLISIVYRELHAPECLADLKIPASAIPELAAAAVVKNLERNIAPISPVKILELWQTKIVPTDER
jgi:alcohol dehydrogenase